jgi:hypothetical protein
LVLCPFLYPSP